MEFYYASFEDLGSDYYVIDKSEARKEYESIVGALNEEWLTFDEFWEQFDALDEDSVHDDENLRHGMRHTIGQYAFNHMNTEIEKYYNPILMEYQDEDYIPKHMKDWYTK